MRAANAEPEPRTLVRYRLDVIAADVDDMVTSAGGWLFDRAMAGWDVNVHLPDAADARALHILGLRVRRFTDEVARTTEAQALAVAGDMLNADARVRDRVVTALRQGSSEVTLWGATWPPHVRGAQEVQHRLSSAARVFKAHALAAATLPAAVSDIETFRTGPTWCPAYEPDLLPIR
ncbi:MAG: hypothetical protein ACM4D3_13210 [Candidatus Sericytochromatia bacterium]